MKLFLVPLSQSVWQQFYSWYEQRGLNCPPAPVHGVWVATDRKPPSGATGPELIAGCMLFPTEGPYIVVEHVSSSPFFSARQIHTAMNVIGEAIKIYSACVGKYPMCFPRHKGLQRMLTKSGFQLSPAVCMYIEPIIQVAEINSAPPGTTPEGPSQSKGPMSTSKVRRLRSQVKK